MPSLVVALAEPPKRVKATTRANGRLRMLRGLALQTTDARTGLQPPLSTAWPASEDQRAAVACTRRPVACTRRPRSRPSTMEGIDASARTVLNRAIAGRPQHPRDRPEARSQSGGERAGMSAGRPRWDASIGGTARNRMAARRRLLTMCSARHPFLRRRPGGQRSVLPTSRAIRTAPVSGNRSVLWI